MESNKDLMGWNAPGSNNSSDEDKRKETDPWGREVKRDNDPVQEILKLLKNFLGNKKSGSGNSSKPEKTSLNLVGLIVAVLLGFYIFSGFYTVKEAEKGVVLRFGKVYNVVDSGLRWKFSGIDTVNVVDIEQVRSIQSSGTMLTEDENVVLVEMSIQYRISDPVRYLYSVAGADQSLKMLSSHCALRYIVTAVSLRGRIW